MDLPKRKPSIPPPPEDDDPALTSCGIGSWRPAWLQVLNNPIYFLINICIIGIVQSMAGSVQYTAMNMLEKRFAFDSKISAIINISDNISVMLMSPIVGYYGIRFNRSRLIGFSQLIIAASCFISASPYFFYGPATHFQTPSSESSSLLSLTNVTTTSTDNNQLCQLDPANGENCLTSRGSTVWPAVIIFMIGQFVRGFGSAIYYVIALPFIDDNVPKKSSSMYISTMQTVMLIGPAAGLVVFSFFLRLPEDPWNDPGFTRNDPRFIGAYWLCYLTVCLLVVIAAAPMFLFPAQFKNASVKMVELKAKMKESGGSKQALKRFLNNPLILLFFAGNATRYSGVIGFYMFYVKYIETTYRISTSDTSQYMGTASLLPMAIGIFGGGVIIRVFRPKARAFFTFLFLAEFVSVLAIGSGLFLGCEPIKLAGSGLQSDVQSFSLQSTCNSNCQCTTRVFSPLCDVSTQTTYFSPCFAGCTASPINGTYDTCSCLSSSTSTATSGYCPADVSKCMPNLIAFILIMVVGNTISSTSTTGNFLINFRAVDPIDKSFASGIIGTLISLFSFIPVPLLYGHIADSSCLIWENKCGKRGNCWLYENDTFRRIFFGTTITFLALGSFFDFVMIFYANRMKNLYGDEEEEAEVEKRPEMIAANSYKMTELQSNGEKGAA